MLFGVGDAGNGAGLTAVMEGLRAANPDFGPLNAYCLMLFCLLYVPCAATLATVKKESGSLVFTLKMMAFELILAWTAAVLVFQIGSLF